MSLTEKDLGYMIFYENARRASPGALNKEPLIEQESKKVIACADMTIVDCLVKGYTSIPSSKTNYGAEKIELKAGEAKRSPSVRFSGRPSMIRRRFIRSSQKPRLASWSSMRTPGYRMRKIFPWMISATACR